jgi:hypothetical protein
MNTHTHTHTLQSNPPFSRAIKPVMFLKYNERIIALVPGKIEVIFLKVPVLEEVKLTVTSDSYFRNTLNKLTFCPP